MTWNEKNIYDGTLENLITLMLSDFYPKIGKLTSAHQWLLQQLANPGLAIPIRHSKSIISDRDFKPSPKVNVFQHPKLTFSVIASDNEANSSLFALIANNWQEFYCQKSLDSMMSEGHIKIGICKNDAITAESCKQLENLGIRRGMNRNPYRVAQRKLKLYHLTDASGASDFPKHGFDSLQDEILTRSYRLLSPLNVFPFPNEPKNFSINITNPPERLDHREFGESSQGKKAFAGAVLQHLVAMDQQDLFSDWLSHSRAPFNSSDAERSWNLWRCVHFRASPVGNADSISKAMEQSIQQKPTIDASLPRLTLNSAMVNDEFTSAMGRWLEDILNQCDGPANICTKRPSCWIKPAEYGGSRAFEKEICGSTWFANNDTHRCAVTDTLKKIQMGQFASAVDGPMGGTRKKLGIGGTYVKRLQIYQNPT